MDVTDQTFESEVLKSETPVIVDFWAAWCTPCRMLSPVVEEFSLEYKGKIRVLRLDVDANPNIAGRFAIFSIPSLLFFKQGRLVDQIVGACTKSKIISVAGNVWEEV